jgi:predicted Zn-dependent protease
MQEILNVLEASLAGKFPDPAIEAMQYAGDVAISKGDVDGAIEYFEDALDHIEATGVTAEKTAITVKLANLHLDQGNMSAAEPLLGYIVEQEPSPAIDELLARYREAK